METHGQLCFVSLTINDGFQMLLKIYKVKIINFIVLASDTMGLYSWLEKKEGGFWGVVVIFAAFMIQIPSFGTAQSFGIYNMYLLKYFKDASPAAVALIGSINVGVFLGSGNYPSLSLSIFLPLCFILYLNICLSLSEHLRHVQQRKCLQALAKIPLTCPIPATQILAGEHISLLNTSPSSYTFLGFFFPQPAPLSLFQVSLFLSEQYKETLLWGQKCLNCITENLCYLLKCSICHSWMV